MQTNTNDVQELPLTREFELQNPNLLLKVEWLTSDSRHPVTIADTNE